MQQKSRQVQRSHGKTEKDATFADIVQRYASPSGLRSRTVGGSSSGRARRCAFEAKSRLGQSADIWRLNSKSKIALRQSSSPALSDMLQNSWKVSGDSLEKTVSCASMLQTKGIFEHFSSLHDRKNTFA